MEEKKLSNSPIKKDKINIKRIIKIIIWISTILFFMIIIFIVVSIITWSAKLEVSWSNEVIHKPNIYLYPEEKTDVMVNLDFQGKIFADYPEYNNEIKWWEVEAHPNGKIINKADGNEYSYLFWEGNNYTVDWNINTWFVIPWEQTRDFLQEILPKMGLIPKEYNEFIVYWYPLIQNNPYNLIYFAEKEYTDLAPLSTIPKYDSMLRVFMVVKPLIDPIDIDPQKIKSFNRKGFTVVEWGWTILKK